MVKGKPEIVAVEVVEEQAVQPAQPGQQGQEGDAPAYKKDEKEFLERLQQRAEKAKPDQLFTNFLQEQGMHVKKPKIKDVSFLAGNGKKTFAFIFTNSNKESVEFKLDRLEPLTEFHAAFKFMPLVAILWRHKKMPLYRMLSLSDGELRIYKFKDLEHDLKTKIFTAHRRNGMPIQRFRWK